MPHNKREKPAKASRAFVTKKKGAPTAPKVRQPAPLPPLTAAEKLHERIEARRLKSMWDSGQLPGTLKGS